MVPSPSSALGRRVGFDAQEVNAASASAAIVSMSVICLRAIRAHDTWECVAVARVCAIPRVSRCVAIVENVK